MFKFIHSSDLHIGKPFGRFHEDLRVRLREARFLKIEKLARLARENDATHILLAGDTFDAETPAPNLLRQTIRAIGQESDIQWVILPGNHDSLSASEIWDRFRAERPENVSLALQDCPLYPCEGVIILPAPLPVRQPGRDLTEWMESAATPQAALRIGLAHGAVRGFGEGEQPLAVIPPDRAQRAGLDYLALGDWHGRVAVSTRCHYSGAPEADSFKGHRDACALLVELAAASAPPKVTEIATGNMQWHALNIDFRPGEDIAERLADTLPQARMRRNSLVQITAYGRLGLSERAHLLRCMDEVSPDFAAFEPRLDDLDLDHDTVDLDEIDATTGALRQTAETLLGEAGDPALSEADRKIAQAALARLYGYALDTQP